MREPFILFRRPDGAEKGKMFYVEFWDASVPPQGKYVGRTSVGKLASQVELPEDLNPCKKADARAIVELWRQTHTPSSGTALLPYLESFWLADGDYSRRYAMDNKYKKALSSDYLYNNRKNVKNHFKPFLEGLGKASLAISHVTPKLLMEYKVHLDKKGIASSTINGAIKAVFVPINDFWMLAGAPERSPARLVSYAAEDEYDRDILSIAEAGKVFGLEGLSQRDRLLLQLSAFAGLRVSEACAARPERLVLEGFEEGGKKIEYYSYIIVEQTRGRKPKAGSSGEAPIPYELGKELLDFYKESTLGKDWIFDGKTNGTSMQRQQAENISNDAICKALKISDEQRVERGLTFHAWRHWYVTHIQAATNAELAQKLARHKSARMTAHYTHLTIEERQKSAVAGAGLFGKVLKKPVV